MQWVFIILGMIFATAFATYFHRFFPRLSYSFGILLITGIIILIFSELIRDEKT